MRTSSRINRLMELKKLLLILAIFALPFTAIYAQDNNINITTQNSNSNPNNNDNDNDNNNDKVKAGIMGGISLTTLYNAGGIVTDDHAKIGFLIGPYAQAPLTKFIGFQTGLLLKMKGAKSDYTIGSLSGGNNNTGNLSLDLYYLEVPLLGVLNLSDNISVMAGPYAGFLIASNLRDNSSSTAFDKYTSISTSDFNRVDYGLAGGIALDVTNWDFGLRYNYGLRNIGKTGLAGELLNNARNAGFQFYVGVHM